MFHDPLFCSSVGRGYKTKQKHGMALEKTVLPTSARGDPQLSEVNSYTLNVS